MKIIHLLFSLCVVEAQAQGSMTLTNCTPFWKNGAGVTGATISIGMEPVALPTTYVLIPMDSIQSCVTTMSVGTPEPDSRFTVNAYKEDDPLNGISVLDLTLISKSLLGLEPLPSPYAVLAADVNRSGSITAFDIVEIRKLMLGIYTEWPNSNGEWRFIPEYIQFPNPLNPFQIPPDDLYLTAAEYLAYNNDTLDVIGLKVGDVDGDANPRNASYQPTGTDSLFVILPDTTLSGGGAETIIPVMMSVPPQAINGFQFKLKYKTSGISAVEVLPGTAQVSLFSFALLSDGLSLVFTDNPSIPIVQGQAVFNIKFKNNSPGPLELKDVLEISSTGLPAIAVNQANPVSKIYRLKQQFGQTSSIFSPVANTLRVLSATPNPFIDQTFIQVELTETCPVLLEVFDPAGRLCWSAEQTLPAGWQTLEIPAAALKPGSLGWYRVRAGAGVATGKLSRQ